MSGVNAAIYEVYTREEMPFPVNKGQEKSPDLHNPGDGSSPRPFEMGGARIGPSHLLTLRDAEVPAPEDDLQVLEHETEVPAPRDDPRQVLEKGIGKAFLGKISGIKLWDTVRIRIRLRTMTLSESRGIWQTIANEVAADCFGPTGHVDVAKLRTWMAFFGNAKAFKQKPLCFIPRAELMRSQMHRVCECLLNNQNGARDRLDAAASITVGEHGHDILAAMVKAEESPLNPAVAILASLLVPHRQWNLPTCTINSLINAEIRNHPERLISMYVQMLSSDQFHFPSRYPVKQQPIVNGFITADLENGGKGRNAVFEDIMGGNRTKATKRKTKWRKERIKYDEAEKYKLRLPIHNMNDVLFAHLFQVSNFGNRKVDDGEYGAMLVYAGHRELGKIRSAPIKVGGSNFPTGMAEFKKQAADQQALGHSYMRVVMKEKSSNGKIYSHAENIDIAALLALDLNNMEPRKAYVIDDRNWTGDDMSWNIPCLAINMLWDIPRLAVRVMPRSWFVSLIISPMRRLIGRNVDNTPTYEFGTLQGSTFEKEDLLGVRIYSTNVEEHDAAFWDQYAP